MLDISSAFIDGAGLLAAWRSSDRPRASRARRPSADQKIRPTQYLATEYPHNTRWCKQTQFRCRKGHSGTYDQTVSGHPQSENRKKLSLQPIQKTGSYRASEIASNAPGRLREDVFRGERQPRSISAEQCRGDQELFENLQSSSPRPFRSGYHLVLGLLISENCNKGVAVSQ